MARNSCTGRSPMLCWLGRLTSPGGLCWTSGRDGAVSHRLVAAGAHVVAVDASLPMLAHRAASRPPGVVGDIARLPLLGGAVDGAAAAFVLNHLTDPVDALIQVRRVLCRGGFVVASVFSTADRPAAKAVIEGVMSAAGWQPPGWYRFLKTVDAQLGSAPLMVTAAESAGLEHIDVVERAVPTGVTDPHEVLRYRLHTRSSPGSWLASTTQRDDRLSMSALPRWPSQARPSSPGSCRPPAPEGIERHVLRARLRPLIRPGPPLGSVSRRRDDQRTS